MSFTTQSFIFFFLPICLVLYYLSGLLEKRIKFFKKIRIQDLSMIGLSSVFYAWAIFDDIFRFYFYIFIVFLLGKIIENRRQENQNIVVEDGSFEIEKQKSLAFPILLLSILFLIYILIHFKYTGLLADIWNFFFKRKILAKTTIAPLGISFITFSAISYLVDIYRGDAKAGSLIDSFLYLLFFPKVVSGPIVLWKDFSEELSNKKITLDSIADGMTRIMIGFSKKLILADTFGQAIAEASASIDQPTAWGLALLYMLQIYFDFSGYSDIAIGLSKLLGYNFEENFNFPYISTSITEFWRRWHISLGRWFREYIYFPLGGSRKGETRTIINVGIVFLVTGIWHGAGWTYMLWGMLNGLFNILEKLVSNKKWALKTPKFIKWIYAMTVTFFSWQLFSLDSKKAFSERMGIMFGRVTFDNIPYTWRYIFDSRMIFLVVIGILGSTVFGLPKVQEKYKKLLECKLGFFIHQIVIILLFMTSILFMVNSDFSPFIYFQY